MTAFVASSLWKDMQELISSGRQKAGCAVLCRGRKWWQRAVHNFAGHVKRLHHVKLILLKHFCSALTDTRKFARVLPSSLLTSWQTFIKPRSDRLRETLHDQRNKKPVLYSNSKPGMIIIGLSR
ncbi:uncharacterized protein RHO17_025027 isoform 2-T2 [Thomomys bottae]